MSSEGSPWEDYGTSDGPWSDFSEKPKATAAPPAEDKGGIGKNFVAGFTEGLTSLPSAVLDPASRLYDSVSKFLPENSAPEGSTAYALGAGRKNTNPVPQGSVTHALNKGLGLIGLNPEDVPAEDGVDRVARLAGTGATALLLPGGAGAGAEELAAGVVPKLAAKVSSRAANTPVATAARQAFTGTAAGATGGLGEEAVPDDQPVLKSAVGVLASIAGGAAAEAPALVRAAAPAVKRFVQPMTVRGQDQIAADTIRSRATNPALVADDLDKVQPELVPGSKPTTFQQTGDMGLGSLERETAAKNPAPFVQRRVDQNSARHGALQSIQEGGDPDAVGTFLRGQFRNFDDQTQQHIDALTAHAQQQTEALGGHGVPEEHGAGLRSALQDAENSARSRERSLWQAVDPDRNLVLGTTPTVTAAKDIAGSLSSSAKPMAGEEKAIFDVASNYGPQTPFADLSDLRSRTSAAMREELVTNGATPAYARLSRLRGAIQNNISEAAANQATNDAAAVAAGTLAPEQTLMGKLNGWVDDFYGNRAQSRAASGEGVAESASPRATSFAGADGTGLPPKVGPVSLEGDTGVPEGPGEIAFEPGLNRADFGKTHMYYAVSPNKPVSIDLIRTQESAREQGSARAAMQQFLSEMDKRGVPVSLTPEPVGSGSSKPRLTNFYKSLGFKPNSGRKRDFTTRDSMIRQPIEPPTGAVPLAENMGPKPFDQDAADRLAEATGATKERVQQFGQGPAKQVLAKAGTQDAYRLPEARVPEKFFHTGPTSFQDIQGLRASVGDEAAMPILRDYAAASLRKAAERPDGTLDPRKVTAWQTKYGNALRAFPELEDQFSTATRASEAVTESAASRREAIADRNASALGKVMNANSGEDVTKTVGSILGGKNATQAMQELAQAASRSPEAQQGLRQAVADHISGKFISNTEAGTSGQNLFKADGFQTFVKKNRGALASVFSPEELDTLDRIAADMKRANRSVSAVKLPGGSNTAQDLHGMVHNNPQSTVLDRAISEASAAAAGAAVGHAAGAGLGWMGAKVANSFRAAGFKKVDDLIAEALLHPDLARDLLRRAPAQPDSGQSIALASRLRRIALATAATRLGGDQKTSP